MLEKKLELIKDGEQWVTVEEFPRYEVSTHGRVRKWMGQDKYRYPSKIKMQNGFYKISFVDEDTKIHGRMLGKLVYETFLGVKTNRNLVHLDGDAKNCALINLATIEELVEAYKEKLNEIINE